MTSDEMIIELKQIVGELSAKLVDADYALAITKANRELGWPMPVTSDFQILWTENRAHRHLVFRELGSNVGKFDYDKAKLDQMFTNALALVQEMDAEYQKAREMYPAEFSGADGVQFFGTLSGMNYQRDDFGNDTTQYAVTAPSLSN